MVVKSGTVLELCGKQYDLGLHCLTVELFKFNDERAGQPVIELIIFINFC